MDGCRRPLSFLRADLLSFSSLGIEARRVRDSLWKARDYRNCEPNFAEVHTFMSTLQERARPRKKSIQKRQRILDATAKLIAEKGTHDITLQDVGSEVGMYAASIYYYFASREELIKEVHVTALVRMRSKVAEAVDAMPDDSTALDRLHRAMMVTIGMNSTADDYALAYTRVLDRAVAPDDEEIRDKRRSIRALWLKLLEDARDSGDLDPSVNLTLLRFFLMGAMHWVSYWYRENGSSDAAEIAQAFYDFLIRGAGRPA